jgi:hypothetical protein
MGCGSSAPTYISNTPSLEQGVVEAVADATKEAAEVAVNERAEADEAKLRMDKEQQEAEELKKMTCRKSGCTFYG